MLENALRHKLQENLFSPLAKALDRLSAQPWHLTLASLLLGITSAAAIALGYPLLALCTLWGSGLFDVLDGTLARIQKSSSDEGAFFDILSDRIVEFAVILGFFLVAPEARALASLLMLGSVLLCVTTFLLSGLFEKNSSKKSFHYSPGLMERAEAFLFFSAFILFPSWFAPLALFFSVLTLWTALFRALQFGLFSF